MDVGYFLNQLLEELSNLKFVKNVDFNTEAFILKGKAFIDDHHFLQVYYNSKTNTIAFSLLKDNNRIWGIDYDYLRGWHLHPYTNPREHIPIKPKSVKQIIMDFAEIWGVYIVQK